MKKILLVIAIIALGCSAFAKKVVTNIESAENVVIGGETLERTIIVSESSFYSTCENFVIDTVKQNVLNTKILKARTAIQEEEIARMEFNFTEINPDTLDSKKPVIYIAKDGNQFFAYLKVKTKYYRIDWFDANLDMKEMIYNLRQEGDSLILFGNKGVKLISIQ